MENITNAPFLLLYSEAHALEKARTHALRQIVFGIAASNPENPNHKKRLARSPLDTMWDIDKNEAIEATLAISLTLPPNAIAKGVSAYLDQWPDSRVVSKGAYPIGHQGTPTDKILARHGIDHEDIHLERLTDPALKIRAHAEARQFGWKPDRNMNESYTVLYSEQHMLYNAKLRMIDKIVFGLVVGNDIQNAFHNAMLDGVATAIYRDLSTSEEKEASYNISNGLPKEEREEMLGTFRTLWTDSKVLSYDSVFVRVGKDALTVLNERGLDREDAHMEMLHNPKMAAYGRMMAIKFGWGKKK